MGAFYSKPATEETRENHDGPSINTTTTGTSQPTNNPDAKQEDETKVEETKTSKNQLKRQRKWEQAMAIKRRRKDQERNIRIAQAKADGRDIEMEKETQEQNRKEGKGWVKRDEKWKVFFEDNSSKFGICLDCSFENVMQPKEINSLASQIRYCYAANKKAKHPVNVKVTSIGGTTLEKLENVSGFDTWTNKAFYCTPTDVLEAYENDKSKLVYLTSDSNNVLDTLEDGKVYIIGGIVDRNRLKRAAINRAEELVSDWF